MSEGVIGYEEAAAFVLSYARSLTRRQRATEQVSLAHASGRVLGRVLVADEDQPPFARSTRDGFACRAAEAMIHAWMPVAGSTQAGQAPGGPLPEGALWEIMTGAPVPAGANAVVMVEHVEREGERVRLADLRKIGAGDNVVAQGAQSKRGDAMVAAGTVVGTAQIALAATCGYASVEVYAKPRVAILTTGDELVGVDATPGPGQIRNSNAPMLAALVSAAGGEPWVLPTAADAAEALDEALQQAMKADMLLISGGVSAGKFDLVEPALARLGAVFHFTGVRMQPGKPLVFGTLRASNSGSGAELPFFGLPGNPISSAATFLLFGAIVLAALAGSTELEPRFISAQLTDGMQQKTKSDLTRFLPALCAFGGAADAMPEVRAVPWHGSGDLPALARANCLLVVPEASGSLEAGAVVRILTI